MNTFTAQTENYVGNTASRVSNGIQVYTVYTGLKEAMYCIRYMYTGINGISLTLINRYIDVRFFPVWIIPLHQNIGRAVWRCTSIYRYFYWYWQYENLYPLKPQRQVKKFKTIAAQVTQSRRRGFQSFWKVNGN